MYYVLKKTHARHTLFELQPDSKEHTVLIYVSDCACVQVTHAMPFQNIAVLS